VNRVYIGECAISVWLPVRDDEDVFVLAKPIIAWLDSEGYCYKFEGNFRTEPDGQFMIEFKVQDEQKKQALQKYWYPFRWYEWDYS
jgi:hypothetical protein